jgi:hypothetical protein
MTEQVIKQRNWKQFSQESFKKLQDLDAVVANNTETIEALGESIEIHRAGLELLVGDQVAQIRNQFEVIIERLEESRANLVKYNERASFLLDRLEVTTELNEVILMESILKIVAFK